MIYSRTVRLLERSNPYSTGLGGIPATGVVGLAKLRRRGIAQPPEGRGAFAKAISDAS